MKFVLNHTGIVCLAICLAVGVPLSAQNASVSGRVTDAQQLGLSQSTVELVGTNRATVRSVSDATGHYEFNALAGGDYTLRFSRSGFQPSTHPLVHVGAGANLTIDAVLQVQEVSESVTVTADNDRLVASRTEIPLRQLPVTVQTVNSEVMAQQGVTDLVSALRNVPNTNSFVLYGMYEYYVFRGFGFDNIVGSSVLLDGLRLEGNRMNSQLNSIESVEVLKGPASMLYGTESTGGTVNLVRKKPSSSPNYEGVVRGGRWGRFGAEFGATGPIKSNRVTYRADVAFDRADGWRDAGWRRFNATPSLNVRLTNRDQLNFVSGYNQDRYRGDAGIPLIRPASEPNPFKSGVIPNVPFSTRYTPPTDFQGTRDILPQLYFTHIFNDNFRLRNGFTYRYFEDQYLVTETLGVNPAVQPYRVDREFFYFFHHRRPAQNQTDLLATVKTGKIEHQFVFGYDLLHYANQTERSSSTVGTALPSLDLLNPRETFFTQLTTFKPSRLDYFNINQHAFYFQDFIKVTQKLTFLGSGRIDAFRRNAYRNPIVNGVETNGAITRVAQNPFTYRLAANYRVLPTVGLYLSYGTSFRAQTSLSADGKNLKPESGKQVEFGQRFDFLRDRITLNTALFHIVKKNVTVSRANGIFDQAGQMTSRGFEADLKGRITPRFSVKAAYGFTQAQFDDFELEDGDGVTRNIRGATPAFVPRHTASFWGVYDVSRQLQVAIGQRYLGRAPVNNFDYFYLGGYTLWDAAVYYRRSKVEYSVNLNNALNKDRYLVASINDYLVYPGKPFDITGTIRFHF
jgi:iron complex outermembrane recepter protein